jgi:hypothetical protein
MAAGIAALIQALLVNCCRRQIDIVGKWRVGGGEVRRKNRVWRGMTVGMNPAKFAYKLKCRDNSLVWRGGGVLRRRLQGRATELPGLPDVRRGGVLHSK